MHEEIINIPVIGFKDSTVVKQVPYEIVLTDKYIQCSTNCIMSQMEEDEFDVRREVENKYRSIQVHLKRNVVGSLVRWSRIDEIWRTQISCMGTHTDIEINFQSMKEAKDLHDKIINWLISD